MVGISASLGLPALCQWGAKGYFSPKKVNIKKGIPQSVVQRSLSISENNIAGIALKKLALFGQNKTVDLNIVKNLDKKNKKFMEILSI